MGRNLGSMRHSLPAKVRKMKIEKIEKDCSLLQSKYLYITNNQRKAITIPIYKKGDKGICGNTRGIGLLSVPRKVFTCLFVKFIKMISMNSNNLTKQTMEHTNYNI